MGSTIKPRHNQAVDSKLKMQAYLQGKREKDRILADSQSDPLSKLLDDSDEEKKNVQASQTIKVQQAQHTFTSSPNKAQQTAFVPELPNITSGNENDYGGDRDDEDTDSNDFDNVSALSDPFLTKKEKEKEILKNAAYLKRKPNQVAEEIHSSNSYLQQQSKDQTNRQLQNSKSPEQTGFPEEWTQTDHDKMISQGDWNSVSQYIAQMRLEEPPIFNAKEDLQPDPVLSEVPKKRFGARSQLQYNSQDDPDESSDGSSWDDDTMSSGSSIPGMGKRHALPAQDALPKYNSPQQFGHELPAQDALPKK